VGAVGFWAVVLVPPEDVTVSAGAAFATGVAFVGFWGSFAAAVRVVPVTDGVTFETVAIFVLPAAPPVAAPRAGVDPAEAAFSPLDVPAAGGGAPAPLALPVGPLVAGGVSGA
jgi:hypothetical protein